MLQEKDYHHRLTSMINSTWHGKSQMCNMQICRQIQSFSMLMITCTRKTILNATYIGGLHKTFRNFRKSSLIAVSDLTVLIWLLRSWVVFLSPAHNSYKFYFKIFLFVIRWCFDWTENILKTLCFERHSARASNG